MQKKTDRCLKHIIKKHRNYKTDSFHATRLVE